MKIESVPRTQRARRAALALLTLAVCLGAAEAVARWGLGLGTPPLYEADADFEYRLRPDQSVNRFGQHISVNRWGMRSDDFEARKTQADELRVVIFGDSVINGGNEIDQSELASTRLQTSLRAALARRVLVANASAGSWGPGNWLGYARRYGFFDADLVVLMVNSGDQTDNPSFAPLGASHPTSAPVFALGEAVHRYLPRYLPERVSRFVAPVSEVNAGGTDARPAPDLSPQAALERGLADLRDFLVLAREGGRAVIVLHHPDRQEVINARYAPGQDQLAREPRAAGLPFVPLLDDFTPIGAAIYRDAIHHSALGQRALGDALHKHLLPVLAAMGGQRGAS